MVMNRRQARWAAAPLLLAAAGAAGAATYHVATTGHDANPGTEAAPFKTVQKAAQLVMPGDTVLIRGGTYNGVVLVTRSGAPGLPITFTNYPGESPVLDATGKTTTDYWNGVFAIRGTAAAKTSHIRVSGLRVQNNTSSNGFGISCYYCTDVEIRDNKIYNTYLSGIVVGRGERVLVDGNDIEKANNGGEQENLSVMLDSAFITVTRNVVHDNGKDSKGGEGIDIKQGAHDVLVQGNTVYNNTKVGIYVDAWDRPTYNIRIDSNRLYGNGKSGISLGSECGGPLRNVSVTNNLIYGNLRHGINIGIWGDMFGQCGSPAPTPGNLRDIHLINNTIVGNGQVGIHYTRDAGVPVHPEFGAITVANNLIDDNGHKSLGFAGCPISHNGHPDVIGHYTIGHNLLNGPVGYARCDWGSEMLGSAYVLAAPQLVGAGNLRLKAGSPAIDMGSATLAPDRDADGLARPMNGAWDIGAYEYSGLPSPLDITTTSLPAGTAGSSYAVQLSAIGGAAPYGWRLAIGTLPAGLSLAGNGLISGTPTTAGGSSFTVAVTDAHGAADSQALSSSISAAPPPPPPPPSGQADMALTSFKATKASLTVGAAAEFSFTSRNNGSAAASNARFVLPLPAGLSWVKGGNGTECSATVSQVTCSFGSLAKGNSRTRYLYLRPTVAGSRTLTGQALSDTADSNLANNSATVIVTAR